MKKLPLVASIVAAMALLAACRSVPTVNLTQAGARNLHGKTLTHAVYAGKGFTALTAGDVVFSFGANMAENGEKIAEKYNLEDPALYISRILMQDLSRRYHMKLVSNGDRIATDSDLPVVIDTYPDADYILDVKTYKWGFGYFPFHWGTYRALYGARVRLINASEGTVAAEGSCDYSTNYSEDDPDYKKLLANNAKRLKSMMRVLVEKCVAKLETRMLDIDAGQTRTTP